MKKVKTWIASSLFALGLISLAAGEFYAQKDDAQLKHAIQMSYDHQKLIQAKPTTYADTGPYQSDNLDLDVIYDINNFTYHAPSYHINGDIKLETQRAYHNVYQAPDSWEFDEKTFNWVKTRDIPVYYDNNLKMNWKRANNGSPVLHASGTIHSAATNTDYTNFKWNNHNVLNTTIDALYVSLFNENNGDLTPNHDLGDFKYYINGLNANKISSEFNAKLKADGRSKYVEEKNEGGFNGWRIKYFNGSEDFKSGISGPFDFF